MINSPHVLIVDDDEAMLQALPQALCLRIEDIKVDTCDTASAALDLIREHDYDAIISDIKMPGMDGLELLRYIQKQRPDTPTLLITGHGAHDLAIQALRGGAYDYIPKPVDRDYFIVALQRAIQTRQLKKQVEEQQVALNFHALALERMIQKRTSELVEANAAKDKFLSIVSHELKTPITSLKSMTQLLLRQIDNPDNLKAIRQGLITMGRSVERMDLLVKDLLDVSLIESNMFVLHRKRCNLVDICHQVLDEYTGGTGPTFAFESPGAPIEVEIDDERISQVLINLLSNAQKYSAVGAPITVTLQQAGYEVILVVRDMGVGIPEEELPHIFDQFYRAPGVEVQDGSYTGLGLGLYITKKIVERHGGRIDVQSVVGHGTVFSIMLPLFIDPEKDNENATKAAPHTQAVWTIAP